jgi:hypothetical protein
MRDRDLRADDGDSGLTPQLLDAKWMLFGIAEMLMAKFGSITPFGGVGFMGTFLQIDPKNSSQPERDKLAMRLRFAAAAYGLSFISFVSEVWITTQERSEAERRGGPPPDGKEAVVVVIETPDGHKAHWKIDIERDAGGKFTKFGRAELATEKDQTSGRFSGFFPTKTFSKAERDDARIILQATDPSLFQMLEDIARRKPKMN